MKPSITTAELAAQLLEILGRVRERGDRFVVNQGGEPVAAISPVGVPSITPRELADRLGNLTPPGDGFADDLEAEQTLQPSATEAEWPT